MAGSIPSNVWESSAISDADLQFISGKVKNKTWSKLTSELGITRLDILKFWNQSRRGIVCSDLLEALDRTDNDLALMFKGWKSQNPSNVYITKKPAGQIVQVPKRPHSDGGSQSRPNKAAKHTPEKWMPIGGISPPMDVKPPSVPKTPRSDRVSQIQPKEADSRKQKAAKHTPQESRSTVGGLFRPKDIKFPAGEEQGIPVITIPRSKPQGTVDGPGPSTTRPSQAAPAHTPDAGLKSLQSGQRILDTYSIVRRTIIVNILKKTEDGEKRGDKNPHDHFRGEYNVTDGKEQLTVRVFGKLTQESMKLLKEGNTVILHGVVLYKNHVSVEKLTTITNFDGVLAKLRRVDLKRYGAEPLKVIKNLQKNL